MSERFFTLKLSVSDTSQSIKLIQGFQKLFDIKKSEEEPIKQVLNQYFGNSFAETIYESLENQEQIEKYKKFIDQKYLDDMDQFLFRLRSRTLNEKRIWQDSGYDDISGYELAPSSIKLNTRSRTGRNYYDDLLLGWDSDDCYILKAAVFATAFESIFVEVESLSTYKGFGA